MASVLNEPYFQDEAAAFKQLEAIVWPEGQACPHCGGMGRNGVLAGVEDKKSRVRCGLEKCYNCRKRFTVRGGTVPESSHVACVRLGVGNVARANRAPAGIKGRRLTDSRSH